MQWPEAAAGSSRTGTISCARLPREHIAHTPYSLDQRAVSELRRLEFPPQVTDVHVDGPVKGCGGSFVEGIHQLIARKDASGGFHQLLKDVEFKSSQLDRDALPSHFTRAGVELDILHAQYALRPRGRLAAAENGPDPGQQFPGIERLGQIVVSADLQSYDAVDILAARREHEHRDVRFSSQASQHLQAVKSGQHHIEHHQIHRGLQRGLQSIGARVRRLYVKPLPAQILIEQRAQLCVIVNQENFGHGCVPLFSLLARSNQGFEPFTNLYSAHKWRSSRPGLLTAGGNKLCFKKYFLSDPLRAPGRLLWSSRPYWFWEVLRIRNKRLLRSRRGGSTGSWTI